MEEGWKAGPGFRSLIRLPLEVLLSQWGWWMARLGHQLSSGNAIEGLE